MQGDDKLRELHARYEVLTGNKLPLNMARLMAWELWESRGLTISDLETVVHYIKLRTENPTIRASSLGWRLIDRVDRFQELLSEANAMKRNAVKETDKDRVLSATGRKPCLDKPAQTPEQIMRGNTAFLEFLKLKESL